MAIFIQGIRIDKLTISRADDGVTLTGESSMMGSNGNVLAKQRINEYPADIKLPISAGIAKACRALSDAVKAEVEGLIGLDEETEENGS